MPHNGVTTDRVAKSHNIIRSSRRAVPMCDIGLGQEWGRLPVVSFVFVEYWAELPAGGQTRDGV
jgi:hypothetical protein